MTRQQAHEILNRCRDGQPMSLFVTNEALYATGDISRLSDKPLRTNGDEPCNDRAGETQNVRTEEGFSYSRYLDSQQTKGVKE